MKGCVFFYHKGAVVFAPWNDVDGNAVDDPVSFYGKDKMDEFCRRIFAKKKVPLRPVWIRFNGKNGDMLRKAVDALLEERIPELVGALRFLCIFRNVPRIHNL